MIVLPWGEWTGPRPEDWDPATQRLHAPVDGGRWPYGPPTHHEPGCGLHGGGLFCDCAASCSDDTEWGVGA